MNQCLTREQIVAILTENLAPEEHSVASEHLNACETCQHLADELTDDSGFRREFAGCGSSVASPSAIPPLFTSGHELGTTVANVTPQSMRGAAPADPHWPPELGRYVVLGEISRGAFGEVWNAYDPILQRNVAVKLVRRDRPLDSRYPDGFLAEGRKLAELDHPGIVRIFDAGEYAGYTYLVTEMLSGGTLASRLQSSPMAAVDAARIVELVARAAHAAHLRGVVHRDIKPGNIILGEDDRPRLADFGLAASEEEMLRESSGSLGTLSYMSPEQVAGHSNQVDARADVYSLGVVLYRCLTGCLPFKAYSAEQLQQLIQSKEPRPPRTIDDSIPPELEAICLKCLRKSPYERYSTARDLADALRDWRTTVEGPDDSRDLTPQTSRAPPIARNPDSSDPGIDQTADGSDPLSGSRRRLRRAWIGIASAALVGCVVLGVIAAGSLRPPPRPAGGPPQGNAAPGAGALIGSPEQAGDVRIIAVTDPPGARIVVYPLESRYGFPDGTRRVAAAERSPVELQLPPGEYLVVAALDDERFHEVYRTVPVNPYALPAGHYRHMRWTTLVGGAVEWPEIVIPPAEVSRPMGWFAGADRFTLGPEGDPGNPRHQRSLSAFYLDSHEVTWAEFLAANDDLPPPSLLNLEVLPEDRSLPIAHLWWNDAVMYAEKVGRRLPSEGEYEFAATSGGTRRFPWGNDPPPDWEWNFGPAGTPEFDRVDAGAPVYGLYSNVAEWTSSWAAPYPPLLDREPAFPPREHGYYIVRGGPPSVLLGTPNPAEFAAGPRQRIGQHYMKDLHPGIGFRCARSARPRLEASDLEQIIAR